jgi:hypothetical protein
MANLMQSYRGSLAVALALAAVLLVLLIGVIGIADTVAPHDAISASWRRGG